MRRGVSLVRLMLREEKDILVDLIGFQGLRVQGTQVRRLVAKNFTMPAVDNLTIESKLEKGINKLLWYVRTQLLHLPYVLKAIMPGWTEAGLTVYVPQIAMLTNSVPALETVYTSWTMAGKATMPAPYNAYQFSGLSSAPDGYIGFSFLAPKTDEQMLVQVIPDAPETGTKPEPWYPLLRDARVRVDNETPISSTKLIDGVETVVTTPKNYVTVDYVPEANEGGRVIKRTYYGPRPHAIPAHIAPLATAVNWDVPGAQDFYKKCLHPDVGVFVGNNGATIIVGPKAKQLKNVPGAEFFPATNQQKWVPYTFRDTQRQDEFGGWIREELIAFPPKLPKTVTDIF